MAFDLSDITTRLRPRGARVLEGVADDPLDALAGGDVLLDRDLVGRALLEVPADADVGALGVLAEDDEVDVRRRRSPSSGQSRSSRQRTGR